MQESTFIKRKSPKHFLKLLIHGSSGNKRHLKMKYLKIIISLLPISFFDL